ncbi:hypothetical protein [Rhodospirillaceae bacterium SYSU D60014]|uniref:hypothetical protein n=1 Tax=Virgifigura deserti TaxID=2268457 RepID=UPI000E66D1C5
MLLERAEFLKAALAKHLALKAAGQQGQVYRSRASQLTPLAESLARAHRDWTAMHAAGLVSTPVEAKPGLRSHAEDLLARFKANRSVLAEADEKFRFQFTPGVRNAIEEFEKGAREAWSAHMGARADFPGDDVLTALHAIPSYRPQVQRIREAAGEFQKLRDRTPTAAELPTALAQADAARRKKDDALAAMQGDDLPPEVLTFLRKTGQGGAALSDLSAPVRIWLEARKLSSAFRIVPWSRN